jgi:hypothetical protein
VAEDVLTKIVMDHCRPLVGRRRFTVGLSMLFVGTLLPSVALAEPAFTGAFKFAGGAAERDALEKAIDDVVSRMNVIARGIARGKLRDATAIPGSLSLTTSGSNLTIVDSLSYTGPLDGKPVKVKAFDDNEMELTYDVATQSVVMKLRADGKSQTNKYAVDGKKLSEHVVITAEQLPIPLWYDLTFERA